MEQGVESWRVKEFEEGRREERKVLVRNRDESLNSEHQPVADTLTREFAARANHWLGN